MTQEEFYRIRFTEDFETFRRWYFLDGELLGWLSLDMTDTKKEVEFVRQFIIMEAIQNDIQIRH